MIKSLTLSVKLVFSIPTCIIIAIATIISILMGILVSMNIYVIRHSELRIRSRSLLSGSSLSIISSVYSSYSSIGFLLISTFGSIGVIASILLTIYQIPLRIISIAILFFALYIIHKRITQSCAIEFGSDSMETDQKYRKDSA